MQVLTVLTKMGAGQHSIPLLRAINNFEISNIAEFIGQVSHETQGFTVFEENLNYSVDGLLKTFSRSRISRADAERYGRAPGRPADKKMIAECLYGHMTKKGDELGNEEPGDGYKFRGRGDIQITGHDNYAEASLAIFDDYRLVDDPDLVTRDIEVGAAVAGWFWKSRGINALGSNVDAITIRVNGGTNGLDDRRAKTKAARDLLSSPDQIRG
ncbi:endolysin glycosidase [Stenotrophomonas phage Silvanus]|nr:endolysin glycosidase [Stenotrophomonas phage Silvanus]